MWRLLLLALAAPPVAGLSQPQMEAQLGPVLLPGMLRQRALAPAALTMKTWASLKEAIDSIGSEVQEVLLVRNDLAMLQGDLRDQEATWHRAEEDLVRQIEGLQGRAQALKSEVTDGFPIGNEVKALQRQVDAERERAKTSKKLFDHEVMLADLEEKELWTRREELKVKFVQARSSAVTNMDAARREEADEAEFEAALQREVARLQDRAADEETALTAEKNVASERNEGLRRDIEDAKSQLQHLEARLLPPAQLQAQVAAMRAQVELEVRALAEVQTAKEQVAAECDARSADVQEAWRAEKAKALRRHAEMQETCDTAEQKEALLDIIVKEACAPPSSTFATTTSQLPSSTLGIEPAAPAPAPMPSFSLAPGGAFAPAPLAIV